MNNLSFLEIYKEKIEINKEIISKFWNFKLENSIPLIIYLPPYYSFKKGFLISAGKYFSDHISALEVQLDSIKSHLENISDNYIPCLNTYFGTSVFASAFGGKIKFFDDKEPWIENIVINDYKDIDKLKIPDPKTPGLLKEIFFRIESWKKATNDKIPICIPDVQGPLSVAIDLMGATKFIEIGRAHV